jgi:Methylase involved in ubiquinone/menaquinone biosynthesis
MVKANTLHLRWTGRAPISFTANRARNRKTIRAFSRPPSAGARLSSGPSGHRSKKTATMTSTISPVLCQSSASSGFALPKTHFFGRDLAEYRRLFALHDAHELRAGARVLDVAAGPASFAAEASALGVNVTAVDPCYGARLETLAVLARADHARVAAQMRAKPGLLRPGATSFPDLENAIAARRAAAERFLADYETGFVVGRYVGAALPRLPFADASFDLVLCGHLLFLHAGLFDHDFHLASCRELVRVTRPGGEVRLHPLCGGDGREYPRLGELLDALAAEGVTAVRVPVSGAFFHGSVATLGLRVAGREAGSAA